MTDFDYAPFASAFGRVMTAFRLKLPATDRDELTRTYFNLLADRDLEDVMAAGQRCVKKHKTFPKPVDWLGELSRTTTAATRPSDVRAMALAEADDLARAAALRWEDQPCLCQDCVRAGVDDRPLRFVPAEVGPDVDAYERAFNARLGVVELVGHWAHGEELARWHAARDAFYALKQKAPRTLFDAVARILGDREPGMEG